MKNSPLILTILLLLSGWGDNSLYSGSSNGANTTPAQTPITVSTLPNYDAHFVSTEKWKTFNGPRPVFPKSYEIYSVFEVKRDPTQRELNYAVFENGVRDIKIVGLELYLGGTSSNPVYDLIRNTTDVRSLEIHAEKLIINGLIKVAGAQVIIKAKEVIFNQCGIIDTSPVSKTEEAKQFQNGTDGLNAGDITIIADTITRFVNVLL